MPLHDWTDERGFDALHIIWQNQFLSRPVPPSRAVATLEPDAEVVGSFEADPTQAIHVSDADGHLVAAIELISPRNKDRFSARQGYTNRYFGSLRTGAHLLLIDVLPHPSGFSFADEIASDLCLPYPPTPSPFAMSYRVGEPVPGGTQFAHWRRPLSVGQPLPTLPLPLTVHQQVLIDLESTYNEAARWAFPY